MDANEESCKAAGKQQENRGGNQRALPAPARKSQKAPPHETEAGPKRLTSLAAKNADLDGTILLRQDQSASRLCRSPIGIKDVIAHEAQKEKAKKAYGYRAFRKPRLIHSETIPFSCMKHDWHTGRAQKSRPAA